ncbi:MAG: hypothetical protein ACOCXH_13075 [Cyclobacteriaceae bacterium]
MSSKNIVQEYFKKVVEDVTILVQVNPVTLTGLELLIKDGKIVEKTKMKFDDDIIEDLEVDEFEKASPLEFNLYLKNIGQKK